MNLSKETARRYPWKTSLFIRVKNRFILPISAIDRETPKSGSICELGSGFGMVSLYLGLSSKERTIEGYELSKKRVKQANKATRKIKNVSFLQRNLVTDPVTKRYQTFLMVDFLHHIPYRSQISILKGIAKVQRPGDQLIIKEISKEIGIKYSLNFFCDKMMTRLDTLRFRPVSEWAEIITDLGYEVKKKPLKGIFPHIFIKATRT